MKTHKALCVQCSVKLPAQWTVKYFLESRSVQSQNTLTVYRAIWMAIHTHMKIQTQTYTHNLLKLNCTEIFRPRRTNLLFALSLHLFYFYL